ncbi:glycoside hydrolase family 5 protein [Daldinia loculata]|uniref:glycoside hydrolase family 5 protein n=1 Tax=Daldinia loculata TaxID=103429 RepID=UPI0020C22D2C|nr:glycoside hydrolase family 5 protein [Daldinia loculata]KAI1644567.1 glycoside hydrolase family 5 protein [Daldinia loculata]KAI2785466.1 glycoside hydrolase family 5 protein [Daldinia loculata]
MKLLSLLTVLGATVLPAALTSAQKLPLSTSSRWILDADGQRVKLRCVNWAGHQEANLPEGLNKQSIDYIADFIHQQGFNCVRLTYSIDHALNPDVLVSDSFVNAASAANVSATDMNSMYSQVAEKNPFVNGATTRAVFEAVIAALWKRGVMTILDNHVSKASWCCNIDDGNGWWDEGFGYNDWNSRFFKTQDWLNGLQAIATWSVSQPGVIGMSLRNEVREWLLQGTNGRADWYNYMTQGAERVHGANPDLLVIIGGTQSATDLTHLRVNKSLDFSGWQGKHVWEWHAYSFTVTFALAKGNCDLLKETYGLFDGFVLVQGEDYTAPLILSEFGFGMTGGPNDGLSDEDNSYFQCLRDYVTGNDGEWALWAVQGSYYVRQGAVGAEESWGLLDADWKNLRNAKLPDLLKPMFQVTQGP